jgi:molybdate transport system substrate-binding protein
MALQLLSAGAAKGLVGRVAGEAGVPIEGEFGAVVAMEEKLRAGAGADVVILTRRQIDRLVAEGLVSDAADLGRVRTGVAVRAGDASPGVGDAEALRRAFLEADAIYVPDTVKSTAGAHFVKVLEGLGIRAEVVGRLHEFPNGATAMRELAAAAGRPIGCTQVTEILYTPGVTLAGVLPPAFELATVYTASVRVGCALRETARAFVMRLSGPAAAKERVGAGFES